MLYNAGMKQVTFYTKSNCHLCDQAYKILTALQAEIPLNVKVINIDQPENAAAAEHYWDRIPVLLTEYRPTGLGWPFTAEQVRDYLDQ